MRLPASYAGARRAVVQTAPYAKTRAAQPQLEGVRRRQRVSVSVGVNAGSDSSASASGDEPSSDSPSSGDESDSDSDSQGTVTGAVRVDATASLAVPTVRLPVVTRPSGVGAGRSKRSRPLRLKRDAERRECGCNKTTAAVNAAVNGTVLVKIDDGEDGDDEEEEDGDEEEDEEEEDGDDSSSSSSDSSSGSSSDSSSDSDEEEDEDGEEEDDEDEKKDEDIIVPILPAAAARIKRRALGRRNGRARLGRVLTPSKRAGNALSGDLSSSSSASDGESSQSSDDGGPSSSDEEGISPAVPALAASADVKLDISSGKLGVVGTIDFDASTVEVVPRSSPNDTTTEPSLSVSSFAAAVSPCAVTASAVFLVAVLAIVGFRHALRRRRRSPEYVPLAVEVSTTVDVDKSDSLFPSRTGGTSSLWFKSASPNDEQV